MNSLNIITSRVSPPPSPGPSRSNSFGSIGLAVESEDGHDAEDLAEKHGDGSIEDELVTEKPAENSNGVDGYEMPTDHTQTSRTSTWHALPRRVAASFINSFRWVLSTLAAPGVYLFALLCDSSGAFAPFTQLKRLFGAHGSHGKLIPGRNTKGSYDEKTGLRAQRGAGYGTIPERRTASTGSSSSGLSSESESELDRRHQRRDSSKRHARSKTLQAEEEIAPSRRSIRIKLHSESGGKHRKSQSVSARSKGDAVSDISAQLKSPTSPAGALTRYPRTPAPPRPLIPRRQPSYLNIEPLDRAHQKTLILDLDETLIHSMSKGGRMSTGHMVEVRLNQTYTGAGGHQMSLGPQHPILYWVNKRPHCDDFLRRVSNTGPPARRAN